MSMTRSLAVLFGNAESESWTSTGPSAAIASLGSASTAAPSPAGGAAASLDTLPPDSVAPEAGDEGVPVPDTGEACCVGEVALRLFDQVAQVGGLRE